MIFSCSDYPYGSIVYGYGWVPYPYNTIDTIHFVIAINDLIQIVHVDGSYTRSLYKTGRRVSF